jgi:biotin transport system substrate-specific component
LGNLVIYALGVGWLTTRVGLETAFVTGMLPFVLGDLGKIALASAALPGGWELLRKKG